MAFGHRTHAAAWTLFAAGLWAGPVTGCEDAQQPTFSYYEERVAPILDTGCSRQTTGCHVDNGSGSALGNLDLSSYDALMRRADLLPPQGPYTAGPLLLKAGDPIQIQVDTFDPPDPAEPDRRFVTITTDVRHGGGEGAIARGSTDYAELKRWIEAGHTRTGVPRQVLRLPERDCVNRTTAIPGVDLDEDPADGRHFGDFVSDVQPDAFPIG